MRRIMLIRRQEKDVPDMAKMLALQAPPIDQIANTHSKTTLPATYTYYHAAAGFPMKLTWLATMKNGHYKT